jgi:ssRNA-specific RNase YbeY (16S rRNA maturation enzyme)
MISVQFNQNIDHRQYRIDRTLVEIAARAALQQHADTVYPQGSAGEQADLDLSIVITDDRQVQELNRQFLAIDRTTDVLAFPSGEMDPDTGGIRLKMKSSSWSSTVCSTCWDMTIMIDRAGKKCGQSRPEL